ncbi:MAG: Spy/CpxP family protein refolding chaperone [Bdellovibrionales bacterium]
MKRKTVLALASVTFILSASFANADSERSADDPIGAHVFPPDMVLKHQAEIGLKDKQREAIINLMKKTMSDLVEVQVNMKEASDALVKVLDANKVDEGKAISALHKLTDVEKRVKTVQLTLMIRIKNMLTKEQQEKLRTLPRN